MSLKLDRLHPHYSANKALTKMKYLDLQAAVIARGMEFQEVVEGDYPRLASYFVNNYLNKQNRELLELFDQWVDEKLKDRGYKKNDPVRQFRRFSMLNENNDTRVKTRKLRAADIGKKKRVKKERDTKFGIFKGTKKEYTFNLCNSLFEAKGEGKTIKDLQKGYADKLVEKVTKKFPDAKEKSVKIWMKRCLDELYSKKKK